jgi:hypothetical protein
MLLKHMTRLVSEITAAMKGETADAARDFWDCKIRVDNGCQNWTSRSLVTEYS